MDKVGVRAMVGQELLSDDESVRGRHRSAIQSDEIHALGQVLQIQRLSVSCREVVKCFHEYLFPVQVGDRDLKLVGLSVHFKEQLPICGIRIQ